jgi:hypothetical protein
MDIQYRCLKCLELLEWDELTARMGHAAPHTVYFYMSARLHPLWKYPTSPSDVTLDPERKECPYAGSYAVFDAVDVKSTTSAVLPVP